MRDISTESRQDPETPDFIQGIDTPLWLLQKDDTRFLYISLLLSVTVHIILFAAMSATRIFHPLTGASLKFDLVWFSPTPVPAPIESQTPKRTVARLKRFVNSPATPATDTKTADAIEAKTEHQVSPSAKTKAPQPSQSPTVPAQVQFPREVPIEEPAEMVISRYDGKVVDIVDKKVDFPTFTVVSSIKIRSESTRAVVQTIRETVLKARAPLKTTPKSDPSQAPVVATQSKTPPTEKSEGAVATASDPTRLTGSEQGVAQQKPVQNKISSTSVEVVENPAIRPPLNRSINSFAAAVAALSTAERNAPAREQLSQKQENGATNTKKFSAPQIPLKPIPATLPVTVEKPVPQEAKPSPQPPSTPPMIFHPPVTGDLKLIITGDVEAKAEVSFRPFPKARRSKPFTRSESENHRNIIPIFVRTKENIHEAVVEVTEEGIYTIFLQPANGKGGSARLVLKVHESHQGATTKDLGTRKIDGVMEIAKILMPDGILWSEGSNFTGDMEDADSITKFNSKTGLMWREYK